MDETVKTDKSNNNKRGLLIPLTLLIIVIIGCYICIKIYRENHKSSSNSVFRLNTGTKWGDIFGYYIKSKIIPESQNIKIALIDMIEDKTPEIVITYEKEKINYLKILYLRDNNVQSSPLIETNTIDIIYTIETQTPEWYILEDTKYQQINDFIEGNDSFLDKNDELFKETYIPANIKIKYNDVMNNYFVEDYTNVIKNYQEDLYLNSNLDTEMAKKIQKIKEPSFTCTLISSNLYQTNTYYFYQDKTIKNVSSKTKYTLIDGFTLEEYKDYILDNFLNQGLTSFDYTITDNGYNTITLILNYNREDMKKLLGIKDELSNSKNEMQYTKEILEKLDYNCSSQ